jgi:hypothetical protein
MDEYKSLSHTAWECKYHVVFHSEMSPQDVVWSIATVFGRGIPPTGGAERKPDRGRASDARSRAHDDINTAKVCGFLGGGIHQGEECDPFGPGIWGAQAQFCGAALLGTRVLRFDGRSGRGRDSRIYSEPGAGRSAFGPIESVALTSHL